MKIHRFRGIYYHYKECRKEETIFRSCIQSHLLTKDFSVSELQYLASLLGMSSCTDEMCKTISDKSVLSHILAMQL